MPDYKKRLANNIKLSYIASFFSGLIFVAPIWIAFERQFLLFSEIALLESIAAGITTILELPTGALADLLGRKKTIMIGIFLVAVSNIYFAFCTVFIHFLLSILLFGIGEALISGSDVALSFDTLKELNREKEFSSFKARTGLIFRIGFILAAVAGGYLFQINQKLPFILLGLAQFIVIIIYNFLIEPKLDSEKFSLVNYVKQTKIGFAQIFKNSYVKKLTIFYTIVGGISWCAGIYFEQTLALELGFNDIERSWMFSAILLIVTILTVIVTNNDKIITRKRAYIGFPLILSISLIFGSFVPKLLAPIIFLGVRFVLSMRFTILDRYTNMEFNSKYRATAISALNMLVSIIYVLIVGASGWLQDLYGARIIYLSLGIITALLAFPSGVSLVKEYNTYQRNKKLIIT